MAVGLSMDENGKIKIDGYRLPVEDQFTQSELSEAYVLASKDEIKKTDPKAGANIEAYLSQFSTDIGTSYTEKTKDQSKPSISSEKTEESQYRSSDS